MTHEQAVGLIRGGVAAGERWADLGAGRGTFTAALLDLVGSAGEVWAVDRDAKAVAALSSLVSGGGTLHVFRADFTLPLELPSLDGILLANALHFVRDQEEVLSRIVRHLEADGKLLLVEYDRTTWNPWVPHPIPIRRFDALCAAVGLTPPDEIGRRPSRYHRKMYAAVARRSDG